MNQSADCFWLHRFLGIFGGSSLYQETEETGNKCCCMLEYWNIVLDASGISAQAQHKLPQQSRSLLQGVLSWSVLALQATGTEFVYSLVLWDDFLRQFVLPCFHLFWSSSQHPSNELRHNPGIFTSLPHVCWIPPPPFDFLSFFFFLKVSHNEQKRQ